MNILNETILQQQPNKRYNHYYGMDITMQKRLLNAKDAANYLSISRSKIYQWIDSNKIKSLKIEGRRLFDIFDLDDFVENMKSKAVNK